MRTACLVAILAGLTFVSKSAAAQGLPPLPPGGYYVTCPGHLNSIFYQYAYLPHEGHTWDTAWKASSLARPLGSLAWYEPEDGRKELISQDGKARWTNPQVQVLCWVFNNLEIVAQHYDPVRFGGTVTECSSGGGGGGTEIQPSVADATYDPYVTFDLYDSACGSAGGGGTGDSTCHDEYLTIEISYDDGLTWEVWWQGYVQVCG